MDYNQIQSIVKQFTMQDVYCICNDVVVDFYVWKKFFLPILFGIHPFATHRRGNLSNMTEGIVDIWLT